MKSFRQVFLLSLITLGLTSSLRAWTAPVPVTAYFTQQYSTYAEWTWDCYYYWDYEYLPSFPNSWRPPSYAGYDWYAGGFWNGYTPSGYWQPFLNQSCNFVLAGIYDVAHIQVQNTTPGCTYIIEFTYDNNTTSQGLYFVTGNTLNVYEVQSYYDSPEIVSVAAWEQCCTETGVQSVTDADLIGTASGVSHYATNQHASNNVVIQLENEAFHDIPPIEWSGGSPGANRLQRLVSRASLIEGGTTVTATLCGQTIFNGKIYVFKGPAAGLVTVDTSNVERDDTRPELNGGAWGYAWQGYLEASTIEYGIYYSGGKWKFQFNEFTYPTKWGLSTGYGRADITNPAANPFPVGKDISQSASESTKRTAAYNSLNPNQYGVPSRTSYWSSAMVQQHEFYHIADFKARITTAMQEVESDIEDDEIAVTLSNLAPATVLSSQYTSFDDKVNTKASLTYNAFIANDGHNTRANADGYAGYYALAQSCLP
jgi:hypothetical protein